MPNEVFGRLAGWGLDIVSISTLSALTVALVELIKKHVGIKGPAILVASLVSSFIWSTIFYYPAWFPTILVATLFSWMGASGGFQAVKTIAGKIGEDSIKPSGMDRGPST